MYAVPKKVAKEITKIQRNFLWGGGVTERGINWVKWSDVCRETAQGGLGIKDICHFNQALICKWRWRAITDKDALWVKVLQSKYGDLTRTQDSRIAKISQWWRDVTKRTDDPQSEDWFWRRVGCTLGDGKGLKFWHDNWAQNARLVDRFPRLYLLSTNKDALVTDMGSWEGSSWRWNLEWTRMLRSWESDMASQLVQVCSRCPIKNNSADLWKWDMSDDRGYTVKGVYKLLHDQDVGMDTKKLFLLMWKARVPSKVRVLAWRLFQNRIQTRDQLLRRKVLSDDDDLACPLCALEMETANHLMFECMFSSQVWSKCYDWWGVHLALPRDTSSHLWSHVGVITSLKIKEVGVVLWFAVIWSVWSCRNRAIFKNRLPCVEEVVDEIVLKTWSWVSAFSKASLSFYQWQAQPLICMRSLQITSMSEA